MKKLIELLTQLGLSQYESKGYVTLLSQFPAKPYQIGKMAGIPSAKIYEVMKRLEQKGLITEISGEEKSYVPKDPEIVIREWRESYLQTLKDAQEALKAKMTAKPANVIWNIEGDTAIIQLGKELFAKATKSISLATSAQLMEVWLPELTHAQERGVSLHLIAYGELQSNSADLPVKELKKYTAKKNGKPGTVLAVDARYALFVSFLHEQPQGAWTENPAIAAIAEEYIDDKLFIEQGISGHWIFWGSTE
jgi:sugar-specific transcriptional regulator TrmB